MCSPVSASFALTGAGSEREVEQSPHPPDHAPGGAVPPGTARMITAGTVGYEEPDFTVSSRASNPLTNPGEESVESVRASSTASSMATASGTSSL